MMPFVYAVAEEAKGTENGEADIPASRLIALSPYRLKAVCVGYVTKANSALKQFFTRRAIIIGGPLLAEDASDAEVAALLKAVKECKVESLKCKGTEDSVAEIPASTPYTLHPTPIYIETRNFHDYSRWRHVFEQCGFAYQPHLNIQVACNANHTMSEQRQRQIKKALKNGVVIAEPQSEQEVRDWYQILRQLYRQKVRTPLWSEAFFLQFYRNGVGKYLLVKYDGKVIGGMMCPIFAGKAIYEWYVCGLDEEYREQYPSVMATYAAIEYAKQNGIPMFDFMGAGVPDKPYGVRDFKMEFVGEVVEHGRYLCIRKPLLYKIGKLGVKILITGKIW
jgi:predicted N-acyltransferase